MRIAAERLEVTEFGPQVADAVRAQVAAGDYTALPPGAQSSRRRSTHGWPSRHRHRGEGGGVHLMMQERASGELVGSVSLFKTNWEARSSEIGYGVRADRRGRGYASEAVAAVARWALAEGGMQRIQLCAVTGICHPCGWRRRRDSSGKASCAARNWKTTD